MSSNILKNLNLFLIVHIFYFFKTIYLSENNYKVFKINAQNWLHFKICDIKDPTYNINLVLP